MKAKRILFIAFLVLVFILAMTCVAFADGEVVISGVDAPKTGAVADFEGNSVDPDYEVLSIGWCLPEDNSDLKEGDKFEQLKSYWIKVTLKNNLEDFTYDNYPKLTVDGQSSGFEDGDSSDFFIDSNDSRIGYYSFKFPMTKATKFTVAHIDENGNSEYDFYAENNRILSYGIKKYLKVKPFKYSGDVTYTWYASNKDGEKVKKIGKNSSSLKLSEILTGNGGKKYVLCHAVNGSKKADVLFSIKNYINIFDSCTIKVKNVAYNGKTGRVPDVKITVDKTGKVLKKGTHYKLLFSQSAKNRKKVGTYPFTIGDKGYYFYYDESIYETDDEDYSIYDLYFKINPRKTSIYSTQALRGGFKVKWYKRTKQTSGYQVRYSTTKNFKKGTYHTKTIKNTSRTYFTKKNLKRGKYYYVKVRTYKVVDGEKYYSKWSKVKKIKTRW